MNPAKDTCRTVLHYLPTDSAAAAVGADCCCPSAGPLQHHLRGHWASTAHSTVMLPSSSFIPGSSNLVTQATVLFATKVRVLQSRSP